MSDQRGKVLSFRARRGCCGTREWCFPSGGGRSIFLIYLAERPDEIVAKNSWIVRAALEANLRVHMAVIRKALGERQFGCRYISNIGAHSFIGSIVCIE
jgi:hypothetical protein